MPLTHVDHFLVQTDDMVKTQNWYVDVLGMRVGPHPDFKFPVCWLYLGDQPIVHVSEGGKNVSENRKRYLGQQSEDTYGSGVVDHIAFRASGLSAMLDHLETNGIEFTKRQVNPDGSYQLFLNDPNGIKIELNYSATEAQAENIKPDIMATDLPKT